jgi:hypothetical protein
MNRFSILKMILVIVVLAAAGSLTVPGQQVDCTKTTDADLAKLITEKINAKYPNLSAQVNVHVENGIVYLEGWAASKDARKEIERIAKKTSCVKKVRNNLKKAIIVGCGAGSKPCGDICIPLNQTCNITKSS